MDDNNKRIAELIRANTNPEHTLLACSKIAEDEKTGAEFIIVLREKVWKGIPYLDLRYFRISQTGIGWMKNGITLRDTNQTRESLKKVVGLL